MKLDSTINDKRILTSFKTIETIFNKVHDNFYTYNKAVYKGLLIPITITCPVHGDFKQRPTNHKRGEGCKKCGYLHRKHNKLSITEYTKRVIALRPNIKILSYATLSTEVSAYCNLHGEFTCNARTLLKKTGNCPKCSKKYKRTETDFIKDAGKIHKNSYTYTDCGYINMTTKINITCKKHGVFSQLPSNHLYLKNGCPLCAEAKKGYSIYKPGRLYYLKIIRNNCIFTK